MERYVRFVRGRVSVQNRTLTSIKNALQTWLQETPLSSVRIPGRPAYSELNNRVRVEEKRKWKQYYPANRQAVCFLEAVELRGLDQRDGVYYQGSSCVVNGGPMFRTRSVESRTASKNSWVICLFEEKGNPTQVLASVEEIWKWHPSEEPGQCHYALKVKFKTTTLLTMHRPSGFNLYSANINSARGSAQGEFVSIANIALINPILVPHINNIGGVRTASNEHYYVIDPAEAVAQWEH